MRLFAACPLREEAREFLQAAQRRLAESSLRARLTPVHQMHLTLRFIGETDAAAASRVIQWFESLPALPPGTLLCEQGEYGSFRGGEGLLVYAGLRCSPELAGFVRKAEAELRGMGLREETKPWKAHVTLARNVFLRGNPQDALAALPRIDAPFTLMPPVLFQSELLPGGARHTPVARIGH